MSGFSADQRTRIAAALTLPNRADEIMLEHACGRATYTSLLSSTWAGTWEHPLRTIPARDVEWIARIVWASQ